MQCKRVVGMLQAVFQPDSQEFQEVSERLSTESTYMRSLLHKPSQKENSGSSGTPSLANSSQTA
jgi:hypothetical protein